MWYGEIRKKKEIAWKRLRFIQLLGGMMKKIILNVLVVSCLMSSVPAKLFGHEGDWMIPSEAGPGLGMLAAIGAAVTIGLSVQTAKLPFIKRRWGSLAIGVPAVAFGVPFTPENKALLEAAKNKNNAFLRKKLIELNKNFGMRAIRPLVLLELEKKKLTEEIQKLVDKRKSSSGKLFRYWQDKVNVLLNRRDILDLKMSQHKFKYRAQFENWETLRRLYAAIDAIYYGKGQYQRFFGLRAMEDNEFLAIKHKLDKQLGISDK